MGIALALQFRNHDVEYRNAVSGGLVAALLVHLLIGAFGGWVVMLARATHPQILGYRGPTRMVREIDVIEPNSVQSYFHQRRREGRRRSPEYRVLERLDLATGPDPMPVRQPEKKRDPKVTAPVEHVDLMEPVVPTYRDIAFSQEFVILTSVEPEYPEYELDQRIEGFVLVQVYVHPDGELRVESIVEARTRPPYHSTRAFELAALEAAKKWRILPPLVDGEPRAAWLKLPFDFNLEDVEP